MNAATSSLVFSPWNVTRPATPRDAASASYAARFGPSPITSRWNARPSVASRATASSRSSYPFAS